jgi:hypothetical protein
LCLSARNRKNRVEKRDGFVQPRSAQSGCTGLSGGAPDSVWCARLALANMLLSGLRRWCTTIIHWTVRCAPDCPVCTGLSGEPFTGELVALGKPSPTYDYNSPDCPVCTGLSGEPTVSRGNGRPRIPRVTRGRANGHLGAPDSVRCANGSQSAMVDCAIEGKKSAPDSVRWCTGLSGASGNRRQDLPSWNAPNGS